MNPSHLWNALKREAHQAFFLDPRRLIFLFGAAITYFILFGLLYAPNIVTYVPLAIYDEDQTALSRSLTKDFESVDSFRVVAYVNTEEAMQQALEDKTAYAALHIPKHFDRDSKNGDHSTVLFLVNGSNIIVTNTASSAVVDIMANFSNRLATEQLAARLGAPYDFLAKRIEPISCTVRITNNPTQGYMIFFLIGLAMAAFQQGLFFSVGAAIQHEYKERKQRRYSKEMPTFHTLFFTKILFYWALSLVAFSVFLLFYSHLWTLPLNASLTHVFSLVACFSFAFIGFSILFSCLCRDELLFVRLSILYPVPAFILSGFTWPQMAMHPVVQGLATLFPFTYVANTMRQLLTTGYAAELTRNMTILIVFGVICNLLAYPLFKRRLQKIEEERLNA